MLSDEKFCDQALKFALLEDTEGKFYKLDDYKKLIEGEQTNKDGNLIYLYATDKDAQYTYIKAATDKGYNVLMMNGQLDVPFVGLLEQKNEKSRCERIDSDVIDRLIVKDNAKEVELTQAQKDIATTLFESQTPKLDKCNFSVTFAALADTEMPIVITQSEYMRRMKDMAQFQPGMSFYGEFPDSYTLTLNTNHRLVKEAIDNAETALDSELKPIEEELTATNNLISALRNLDKDGKGVPEDKKKELENNEAHARELRDKKNAVIAGYAASQDMVHQLIDIALLSNGLLKGEALSTFLHRSVDLM